MTYRKNIDSYYSNLLDNLKFNVPEFCTECDSDEQYAFLYEFGIFLIDNYKNDSVLANCSKFIDEALEKGTSITEEAIALQVFQQIYDNNEIISSLKRKLSLQSATVFDYYFIQFNKSFPMR